MDILVIFYIHAFDKVEHVWVLFKLFSILQLLPIRSNTMELVLHYQI